MQEPERDSSPGASPYLERADLPALRSPEPFTGADIIREVPAGPAILLCQAYRAVMLWAATPPQEHAELFAPTAREDAWELLPVTPMPDDLRGALEAIRALTAGPAGADPRAVAAACTQISGWAQRCGAPDTAYRFVQAAGTCAAADARLAYRAGCMARRRSEWYLAKLWFRHAIAVGRRTRDWEGHATAYLGLGNTYYRQGKYPAARREHRKALRVGMRHGLREVQGAAFHNLFAVAVEVWDESAEEYARKAFHAYGPDHSRVPALAHDIAYFWNTRGRFSRALPVFRALLRHFHEREDWVRVIASYGRAAGGLGEREEFERAWRQVAEVAPELEGTAVLNTSFLELAYGAASLRDWERAEETATSALDAARGRGEVDLASNAEELLATIAVDRNAESNVSSSRNLGAGGEPDPFVTDLVRSLEMIAARDQTGLL